MIPWKSFSIPAWVYQRDVGSCKDILEPKNWIGSFENRNREEKKRGELHIRRRMIKFHYHFCLIVWLYGRAGTSDMRHLNFCR